MSGRTIAIGDIHGCADALRSILDEIQPTIEDTIITLGDYVDRGPKSAQVFDILIDLVTTCNFFPLLGNHEIMMAAAFTSRVDYDFWLQCGGSQTLQSYGGDIRNIPPHHKTFLNHCRRFYETDTHFFIHANYDPFLNLNEQIDETIFWKHIEHDVPDPHLSKKMAIVGHTPQESGEIRDLGHIKIIDTFCYGDKWLTAYDVDSGETWQARMDGMLRSANSEFSNSTEASGATNDQPDSGEHALSSQTSAGQTSGANSTATATTTLAPQKAQIVSPLELDGEQFRRELALVGDYLADFLDDLPDAIVSPADVSSEELKSISEPVPETPTQLPELLNRICFDFVKDSFNTASPGYLAYIPGGGLPESAMADLIAQVTNRFITVWSATPKLVQVEKTVVNWFCELIGFGQGSGGYLSSGGSTANQTAIVTARSKLLDSSENPGDYSRATIYVSDQSHHCLRKSAFLAGIPKDNCREIESNPNQSIDIEKLRTQIQLDVDTGFKPFLIVGNAGTTNTGAVDDLDELRNVADEFNCWYHVDAAYGGFFCMTDRGRAILQGIETADSVVLDPHKGMFLPYGTGCLLVKNFADLHHTHSFTSDYMPEMTGDADRVDYCDISPELSRGNRSLRLWLPIKRHGIGVFRQQLDEKLDLIHWLHAEFKDLEKQIKGKFEVVTEPQLSILSFRIRMDILPTESNNRMNRRLVDEINSSGRIMVTGTMLDGNYVIRICILSFRTHMDRIQETVEIVRNAARYVLDSTVS